MHVFEYLLYFCSYREYVALLCSFLVESHSNKRISFFNTVLKTKGKDGEGEIAYIS